MARIKRLNERARYIPTQTDTVVRFAPEHVALVLCFQNVVKKNATIIFKINYRYLSFLSLEMIKPNVKDKYW